MSEPRVKRAKKEERLVRCYPDGDLRSAVPIVNGRKHGLKKTFYNSTAKESQVLYVDGKKHGLKTEWYENYSKKSETTYEMGKIIGLVKKWYIVGDESEIVQEWHTTGKIWCKIPYVDGEIHGTVIVYYDYGTIAYTTSYMNGKEHGKKIFRDFRGKISCMFNNKHGEKHGADISYYQNGMIREIVYYNNNKVQGEDDVRGERNRVAHIILSARKRLGRDISQAIGAILREESWAF